MKHIAKNIWYSGQKLGRLAARGWLHIGDNCVEIEAYIKPTLGLVFKCGGDDIRVGLWIGLLFASIHIGLSGPLFRFVPRSQWWGGYETGFKFFDGYLFLRFMYDEGICGPTGFGKLINLERAIFGKDRITKTITDGPRWIEIPMPERRYKANLKIYTVQHKLERWPWRKTFKAAEIEIPDGIPFPGKGENDYDLDDNAVYSWWMPNIASENEAVEKVVFGILRDRWKRGGPLCWAHANATAQTR